MNDATKLVGGEYWIHCLDDNSWRVARYRHGFKDFTTPQHDYEISEVTDAIPIPSPDQLQADAKRLANYAAMLQALRHITMVLHVANGRLAEAGMDNYEETVDFAKQAIAAASEVGQ